MATGDQPDVTNRLLALLPPWFAAGASSLLGVVLQGPAWVLSQIFSLIQFAHEQTRIASATGGWLDLIGFDFFGRALMRGSGESDAAFRARIEANLLQPAGTRPALFAALERLTGRAPVIIDPWRPGDCGAYGYGGLGYGAAGCYGSLKMPAQTFIIVTRPPAGGMTDQAIYQAVAEIIPAGVIGWSELRG